MRKITKDAAEAFRDGKEFFKSNTSVILETSDNGTQVGMRLHGNLIATSVPWKLGLTVSLCGWSTPTTRERLNGLFDVLGVPAQFYQEKFQQKLSWYGAAWNGHVSFDPHDTLFIHMPISLGEPPHPWFPMRYCGSGDSGQTKMEELAEQISALKTPQA
tara:strand:+ start:272 stop:748 length:477 start_codon:yes stop_codon:yes gene_type:complete